MPSVTIRFPNPGRTPRHMANVQKFTDWLEDRHVPFTADGSYYGSQYVYLEDREGDGYKIRFADHPQKRDEYGEARGGYRQTAYGYDTHLEADYSVAPGEGTLAGAKKFVTALYGGQWPEPGLSREEAHKMMDRMRRYAEEEDRHAAVHLEYAGEYDERARGLEMDGDVSRADFFRERAKQERRLSSEDEREAAGYRRKLKELEKHYG